MTPRRLVTLLLASALLCTAAPATAAVRAATGCRGATVKASAPVGTFADSPCPGVRPGALLSIPSQSAFCTMGFMYADLKGNSYMATAGHCVLGAPSVGGAPFNVSRVWPAGRGPIAADGADKPFGRFVFAAEQGIYDIAIIQISKGVKASPQMCHFGGPTAAIASVPPRTQLQWYGNAVGVGDVLPARTSLSTGQDATYIYALGPTVSGDSGGAVLAGGKAAGYITEFGVGFDLLAPYVAEMFVRRMGPQIAQASKILKRRFILRTAPLL